MKIFCLITYFFLSNNLLKSQDTKINDFIGVSAGPSFNGSGDLRGIMFSTEYSHQFKKKLSWGVNLSGTIHDNEFENFYIFDDRVWNGSVRSTIAGVQLIPSIGYHFIKTSHHELKGAIGILFRYQSSSQADQRAVRYPPAIDFPYPVVDFRHFEPMRIFSVGGNIEIRYSYTFKNNMVIGILAAMQADSNGDLLRGHALSLGYRL